MTGATFATELMRFYAWFVLTVLAARLVLKVTGEVDRWTNRIDGVGWMVRLGVGWLVARALGYF